MIKPGPAFWIILGLVVAALEMLVPGFVIIWFGVAGVVTGILSFFIHGWVWQLSIFAALSVILVASSQLISRRITRPEPEPVGANRLAGARGQVVRDIIPPEFGRVKVMGEEWRAESGSKVEQGRTVRVVRVEGTHLVVEPVNERSQ